MCWWICLHEFHTFPPCFLVDLRKVWGFWRNGLSSILCNCEENHDFFSGLGAFLGTSSLLGLAGIMELENWEFDLGFEKNLQVHCVLAVCLTLLLFGVKCAWRRNGLSWVGSNLHPHGLTWLRLKFGLGLFGFWLRFVWIWIRVGSGFRLHFYTKICIYNNNNIQCKLDSCGAH